MTPWAHQSPQSEWHLYRFSHFWTDHCRVSQYFTMGRPFPLQNCPFPWGIWTPSNTWFLGPPESSTQTNRLADRPRYSICNNRPYLCT